MDPLTLGLIGGGVGLLKGVMDADQQRKMEEQTRNQRAAEIQYSPWTGIAPSTEVRLAGSPWMNMLGGAMQGGLAGATLGQGIEASDRDKRLMDLYEQKLMMQK